VQGRLFGEAVSCRSGREGAVTWPPGRSGGGAADLPADVLQGYLDAVTAGRLTVPIDRTYALDEIAQAHADMEHGRATGKLVVLP
jgi:NADPH:quinone reductase-like Zn-dependent oxidoreductase